MDWIEFTTNLARGIGMNPTRVRWKLIRLQERFSRWGNRVEGRINQIQYEHRLCAACGSIQDRANKVCDQCGQRLLPPAIEKIARLKYLAPEYFTPTGLLIGAILIGYYLSATSAGGNLMSPSTVGLMKYGANFPPYVFAGEWWRLATCIFLHADVMHILFNLVALQQIGPEVEHIFGKGRMLFFFMVTGILASLGSAYWRSGGVGIGASGALMGLVGLAAGWGQRTGGSSGIMARNLMVQWGLYTIVFGLFIGADNAAHIAGLVTGFALGFFARPVEDKQRSQTLGALEITTGIVLFVMSLAFLIWHPQSDRTPQIAKVDSIEVVNCGTYSNRDFSPLQLNKLQPNGDCGVIEARDGTNFGFQVAVHGSPQNGLAYLTARMTHPPIHNPESGEVTSVDEWDAELKLGEPVWIGWAFEHPWELAAGEWTLEIFDEEDSADESPQKPDSTRKSAPRKSALIKFTVSLSQGSGNLFGAR